MRHDALYSFISPLKGRILGDNGKMLAGNFQGVAVPVTGLPFSYLPDLTSGMTWVGNSSNRPVERLYIGSSPFLIRQATTALPNAQNLKDLGTGILQMVDNGYLALAVADVDYATSGALQTIKDNITALTVPAASDALAILTSARAAAGSATAAGEEARLAGIDSVTASSTVTRLLTQGLYGFNNYGDVNIQGYRVTNLNQSPQDDFDAISFTFFWDLMHDNVQILFP